MQAQRLVGMLLQILAHHADTLFHQVIAGGNERGQIAGAAGAFIRLLHNFQRFNGDRIRRVVELHAAAAVKLDVDKTGGKDRTINRALFDPGGQLSLRTDTFDKAIGDNNRMVIQNFMTGINPALG